MIAIAEGNYSANAWYCANYGDRVGCYVDIIDNDMHRVVATNLVFMDSKKVDLVKIGIIDKNGKPTKTRLLPTDVDESIKKEVDTHLLEITPSLNRTFYPVEVPK